MQKKIIIYSIIVLLLLPVLKILNPGQENTDESIEIDKDNNFNENLKISGRWSVSSITIFDTVPGADWAYHALNYDWCSGEGTWSKPYLIENVTLGSGEFAIVKSDKPFIIRNCTITNPRVGEGILLASVSNAIIHNNTIKNHGDGILVDKYPDGGNSHNITISENIINNNNRNGIFLNAGSPDNVTILDNIVNDNGEAGISVVPGCLDCKVIGNTANNNGEEGILMRSHGNIISDNNVINNNDGIYIWASNSGNYSGNSVKFNDRYGIYLLGSDSNNIYENDFESNTQYGIRLQNCDSNLFYNNTFMSDSVSVYILCNNNQWNNTIIGNSWPNYDGYDCDGDGIGETPYYVNGQNIDYLPICNVLDEINPIITINSPQDGEIYGVSAPPYDLVIDEYCLNETWYTLDGGITNESFSGLSGNIKQEIWDNFNDEPVTIMFFAEDLAENIGYSEKTVIKDVTDPSINIISPTPSQLFNTTAPSFIVEFSDPNLDQKSYSLNGGTHIPISLNTTFDQNEWSNLPNGTISIEFYANDKAGNEYSKFIDIQIDAYKPTIQINTPIQNKAYDNSPQYNVYINDTNLKKMWYTLNTDPTKHFFLNNDTIDPGAWGVLEDGSIIVTFFANDSVDNINSESIVIKKDTEAPEITIFSPYAMQFFNNTAPKFNVQFIDLSLNSTWYTFDDGEIFGFTNNETFNPTKWQNLPNGTTTITFFANDSLGHLFFQPVVIMRDIHLPEITIIDPTPITYRLIAPQFNITIIEGNLNWTWYTINDNIVKYFFLEWNGTIDQGAWDDLSDGSITITFWANDTAGNTATEQITVFKSTSISSGGGGGGGGGGDSSEKESIPFNNSYLMFILLAIISIVLFMKQKIKIRMI